LIADLNDPDDGRRVSAAKELRGWGKGAAAAAGPLAVAIATGGVEPRQAALEALEAILPEQSADLHALVADEDPARRVVAERRLAGLSAEDGKSLVPMVDWRIAWLPVEARKPNVGYGLAGDEFAALAPLMLRWGVTGPGFKAVVACASVSPESGKPLWEPAQLTLCDLARNESFRKDALSALDSSLSSRPSAATLQAVGNLGPDAKGLAPLLETLATDRDPDVRKAAANALKKVQGY
jgi:HEAT repeat protein